MPAQLCPSYTQNHLFKKSLKFTSTHAGSTVVSCFCLSCLGHARAFYLLKSLQRVSRDKFLCSTCPPQEEACRFDVNVFHTRLLQKTRT